MHPHKDTHTRRHMYINIYIYMQCFMHTCNYACYNHYIDIFNNAPCTNTFVKVLWPLWPHFVQPLTRLQHFFGRTSTISKQHLWHMQYSFLDMAFLDVPVCAICSSRECAVALYILTMDLCFKLRTNL